MVTIKIKKMDELAIVPKKAHDTDAAFDLYALEGGCVYPKALSYHIRTGVAAQVPKGYYLQASLRSGIADKTGIRLSNGIGVLDCAGYTGEIHLIVDNLGKEPFRFEAGDRIAQFTVMKEIKAETKVTDELEETERGNGGFGSTGK